MNILSIFWLVGGGLSGSQHHQPSGSDWSGVFTLSDSTPSLIFINFPHLGDFSICKTARGYCFVCTLMESQDLAPGLHHSFSWLFASPCLSSFPSLINNCLNLHIGTQVIEAEWRLFPVIKKMGDTERLCAQEPHRALLGISASDTEKFLWKRNNYKRR